MQLLKKGRRSADPLPPLGRAKNPVPQEPTFLFFGLDHRRRRRERQVKRAAAGVRLAGSWPTVPSFVVKKNALVGSRVLHAGSNHLTKYPDTRHFLSRSSMGVTVSMADFLLANEVLYWRITYWPSGAPGTTVVYCLDSSCRDSTSPSGLRDTPTRLDKVTPVNSVLEEVGSRFPALPVLPLIHEREPRLGRFDCVLLRSLLCWFFDRQLFLLRNVHVAVALGQQR